MKTKDIIEGLRLLQSYRKSQEEHNCQAEHDQLYVEATDDEVDPVTVKALIKMGWFQESGDEGDFTLKQYDPAEGWVCNT